MKKPTHAKRPATTGRNTAAQGRTPVDEEEIQPVQPSNRRQPGTGELVAGLPEEHRTSASEDGYAFDATPTPDEYVSAEDDPTDIEPPHAASSMAVAMEALRSGLYPEPPEAEHIPGDDERLRAGDPDVEPLAVEYSGENFPGGATSTPDQQDVDEIGRAYGVSELDSGALVLGEDPIRKRDDRRWDRESLPDPVLRWPLVRPTGGR